MDTIEVVLETMGSWVYCLYREWWKPLASRRIENRRNVSKVNMSQLWKGFHLAVILAKAGIQESFRLLSWIPAGVYPGENRGRNDIEARI